MFDSDSSVEAGQTKYVGFTAGDGSDRASRRCFAAAEPSGLSCNCVSDVCTATSGGGANTMAAIQYLPAQGDDGHFVLFDNSAAAAQAALFLANNAQATGELRRAGAGVAGGVVVTLNLQRQARSAILFCMTWVDSHCHLDSENGDAAELLARARSAGVSRFVAIGIGGAGKAIHEVRALAEAEPDAFGLPPAFIRTTPPIALTKK